MFQRRLVWAGLTAILALAALAPVAAQPSAGVAHSRPASYILPGDQVYPEGVAYWQGTPYFFVSSTTDGTIFRGNLREEQTSVFLPGGTDGRTTAVGLKVDQDGRLFVAGGSSGKLFVYDAESGALLGSFSNGLSPSQTFINDVAVARDGSAYFTDSVSPYIYRITTARDGTLSFERWLDLTGTPFVYVNGFNANGIDVTENGRYLIVVQSATGKLFRIDIRTQDVTEIALEGGPVTSGDGILLRGHTLYVVRNSLEQIAEIRLSGDYSSGTVVGTTTDPSFAYPTTIAIARGRLLVVNSQFDRRSSGQAPDLPFTVSNVAVP